MDIEKFKKQKKEKNLTFKQLSELSGVPLRTIEDMFAQRTKPRIDTVEAVEKALCIDRTFYNEPKSENFVNIKLKELRVLNKKTQQQVANDLGLSQQQYQQYESGKYQPDFETLIKIADFFDVSIDYLLGRTEESQKTPKFTVISNKTDFELSKEEKALILTLRRSNNAKAYIRAMITMLGETRTIDQILSK